MSTLVTCNLCRPKNVYPHFHTVRHAAIADLNNGQARLFHLYLVENT